MIAVSCGAVIIEKHFTLNKSQKGADHKISLEPKEFGLMVKKIRTTERMLGQKIFNIKSQIEKKRKFFIRRLTAKQDIKKNDIKICFFLNYNYKHYICLFKLIDVLYN